MAEPIKRSHFKVTWQDHKSYISDIREGDAREHIMKSKTTVSDGIIVSFIRLKKAMFFSAARLLFPHGETDLLSKSEQKQLGKIPNSCGGDDSDVTDMQDLEEEYDPIPEIEKQKGKEKFGSVERQNLRRSVRLEGGETENKKSKTKQKSPLEKFYGDEFEVSEHRSNPKKNSVPRPTPRKMLKVDPEVKKSTKNRNGEIEEDLIVRIMKGETVVGLILKAKQDGDVKRFMAIHDHLATLKSMEKLIKETEKSKYNSLFASLERLAIKIE